MKQIKKIEISLPDSVLKELDFLMKQRKEELSELIAGLIHREYHGKFISEKEMAEGYSQMAELNLEWAESCLQAESETLNWYEEKLSECEQN